MLNEEKLIDWCWRNLQFRNCPETWEDSIIPDILAGCVGNIHDYDGRVFSYSKIRSMFTEDYEDEE